MRTSKTEPLSRENTVENEERINPKNGVIRLSQKENKSDEEVELMLKYMEELGLLKKGPQAAQVSKYEDITMRKKIVRVFKYQYVELGEILFSKGEEGDCAYMILDGRVAIYSNAVGTQMKKEVCKLLGREYEKKETKQTEMEKVDGDEEDNQKNYEEKNKITEEELKNVMFLEAMELRNKTEDKLEKSDINLLLKKITNKTEKPILKDKYGNQIETRKKKLVKSISVIEKIDSDRSKHLSNSKTIKDDRRNFKKSTHLDIVDEKAIKIANYSQSDVEINSHRKFHEVESDLNFSSDNGKKKLRFDDSSNKKNDLNSIIESELIQPSFSPTGKKIDNKGMNDHLTSLHKSIILSSKTNQNFSDNKLPLKFVSTLTNNLPSPSKFSHKPTRWRGSQMELESELVDNYMDKKIVGNALLNINSEKATYKELVSEEILSRKIHETKKIFRLRGEKKFQEEEKLKEKVEEEIFKKKIAFELKIKAEKEAKIRLEQKLRDEQEKLEKERKEQEAMELDKIDDPMLHIKSGGNFFVALGKGSIIGEISQETDAPRNASGVAADDLELLVISKKDYNDLFADIMLEERRFKMELVDKVLPEIGFYSKKDLTSLVYKIKEHNFAKGEILFKEGQKFDKMYIIIKGTVSVKKCLDTEFLTTKIMPKTDGPANFTGLMMGNAKSETDLELLTIITDPKYERVNLNTIKIVKQIGISILSQGEIIGDEMMILNKNAFQSIYPDRNYLENNRENQKRNEKNSPLRPPKELFDARMSKFTFQCTSNTTAFMLTFTDLYAFIHSMQNRIVKDYLMKNSHRYNKYQVNCIQSIINLKNQGSKEDIQMVQNLRENLNKRTLHKMYGDVYKTPYSDTRLDGDEEYHNIKCQLKSKMIRKQQIKKSKRVMDNEKQAKNVVSNLVNVLVQGLKAIKTTPGISPLITQIKEDPKDDKNTKTDIKSDGIEFNKLLLSVVSKESNENSKNNDEHNYLRGSLNSLVNIENADDQIVLEEEVEDDVEKTSNSIKNSYNKNNLISFHDENLSGLNILSFRDSLNNNESLKDKDEINQKKQQTSFKVTADFTDQIKQIANSNAKNQFNSKSFVVDTGKRDTSKTKLPSSICTSSRIENLFSKKDPAIESDRASNRVESTYSSPWAALIRGGLSVQPNSFGQQGKKRNVNYYNMKKWLEPNEHVKLQNSFTHRNGSNPDTLNIFNNERTKAYSKIAASHILKTGKKKLSLSLNHTREKIKTELELLVDCKETRQHKGRQNAESIKKKIKERKQDFNKNTLPIRKINDQITGLKSKKGNEVVTCKVQEQTTTNFKKSEFPEILKVNPFDIEYSGVNQDVREEQSLMIHTHLPLTERTSNRNEKSYIFSHKKQSEFEIKFDGLENYDKDYKIKRSRIASGSRDRNVLQGLCLKSNNVGQEIKRFLNK